MGRQNTLEGSIAIQSDLSKLEECFVRNIVKFSKGKWKVLHLGKNNFKHQYMLGTDKQLGRKGAGVPVDENFTMSQKWAFLEKKANSLMEYIRKSIISKLKEMILPLCSGETAGVLGPVLSFPVEDRHEHNIIQDRDQPEKDDCTYGPTREL